MLVTLTNTDSITLDLPVESVTWSLPVARQYGEARLTIPRVSDAFAAAYVNEDGGSLVQITDGLLGDWRGVINTTTIDTRGLKCSVAHIAKLLAAQRVSQNRTFHGLPPGAIAYAAVLDGVAAIGPRYLGLGTFLEAAPAIDSYTFSGQGVIEVLDDLMERAPGQEWTVDDATGKVSWVPAVGSLYATHLFEGGDLVDPVRAASNDNQVAAVTARTSTGTGYTARAPEVAGLSLWAKHEVISVSSPSTTVAGLAAAAELARLQFPDVRYTLKLRREGPAR